MAGRCSPPAKPDMLDSLPPLRDVIARHNLKADKKLGQNFLLDQNITDKIVRQAGNLKETTVFEIGPGPGGLTRSLLAAGARRVVAVEFDPRAVSALQELKEASSGRLEIVQGDALSINLVDLAPADTSRAIMANLPYNIATPLTIGWLEQLYENPEAYAFMILMFQREVGERLTASPGSKTYGRLSVMAQWLCKTERLFDLPPSVFVPPPKVTSSVIRFTPRLLPPDKPNFHVMEAIVKAAFGQRRKMIRSSMKDYCKAIEKAGIDDTKRAEDLDIGDFTAIARLST